MQATRLVWADGEGRDVARDMRAGGVTGLHPTRSGSLYISANTPHFWQALCELPGLAQLASDPQFETERNSAQPARLLVPEHRAALPVDENVAGIGLVISHQALHQRALSGAVLAQQGVHAPGGKSHRYSVQRLHRTEPLGKIDDLDLRGARHHRDIDNSLGAPESACVGEEL